MEQTAQGARPHCAPRLAVLTDLQVAIALSSIDTLLQFDSIRYRRPERRADAQRPPAASGRSERRRGQLDLACAARVAVHRAKSWSTWRRFALDDSPSPLT